MLPASPGYHAQAFLLKSQQIHNIEPDDAKDADSACPSHPAGSLTGACLFSVSRKQVVELSFLLLHGLFSLKSSTLQTVQTRHSSA
jgi:hypothetical protein